MWTNRDCHLERKWKFWWCWLWNGVEDRIKWLSVRFWFYNFIALNVALKQSPVEIQSKTYAVSAPFPSFSRKVEAVEGIHKIPNEIVFQSYVLPPLPPHYHWQEAGALEDAQILHIRCINGLRTHHWTVSWWVSKSEPFDRIASSIAR